MATKVVSVALRKVQMGTMPDVEGQLSSFLGMPSCFRRSVLAPLDNIKELSLQWVLMPKLDNRGCIQASERIYVCWRPTVIRGRTSSNQNPKDLPLFTLNYFFAFHNVAIDAISHAHPDFLAPVFVECAKRMQYCPYPKRTKAAGESKTDFV